MQEQKPKKSIFQQVFTKKKTKQQPPQVKREDYMRVTSQTSVPPSRPWVDMIKIQHSQIETASYESNKYRTVKLQVPQHQQPQKQSPSIVDQFRHLPLYKKLGEDWLDSMKFDHFFATLKSKEDLPDVWYLMVKFNGYSQLDGDEDDRPRFGRHKQDRDWKYHSTKTANSEPERRRSGRIQKIQAREQLQTQMLEMSYAYHQASYRYGIRAVAFRLSYLEANCLGPDEYEQIITDIPAEPEYRKLQVSQLQKILGAKAQSLQSRIIK